MSALNMIDIPVKLFHGTGANDVWLEAMCYFDKVHSSTEQDSRLGATHETLHANFHITDPKQRWVLSRQPAISPAFAIAEIVWILSGKNDSKFLNFWNPALPKYMGTGPTYHGAYGHRIMNQFAFDQLERAFQALKANPDSRQVVIQIWNSEKDFPSSDGSPVSEDIPCNICSMPKVRDGKLEWLQIMRSNDLYRGTPYNVVQFTTIQEILAGWLGLEIGAYHQISDSLHIYCSDLNELSYSETKLPSNDDQLALPKNEFDKTIHQLDRTLRSLAGDDLTTASYKSICTTIELPGSYKNLFWICAADAARRHQWFEDMDWAAEKCTNKILAYAWDNWKNRWLTR